MTKHYFNLAPKIRTMLKFYAWRRESPTKFVSKRGYHITYRGRFVWRFHKKHGGTSWDWIGEMEGVRALWNALDSRMPWEGEEETQFEEEACSDDFWDDDEDWDWDDVLEDD